MTTKVELDHHGNDRLARMIRMQRELQTKTFNFDFESMSTQERVNYIKENVLALTDELHELLAETSWKPWAKSEFLNEDKAFSELVDAWHFMMNIMLAISTAVDDGDLADMLTEAYFKKRMINVQRQEDGYDGRSTKCPTCKRALDDPSAVTVKGEPDGWMHAYCVCGADVTDIFITLGATN